LTAAGGCVEVALARPEEEAVMSAPPRPTWTREDYDRDADEYLASLPLDHFMESTPQAAQRKITLASHAQVEAIRSGFVCFNELLIHGRTGEGVIHVVPDNMVVLGFSGDERLKSWAVELAPCPIFWVLEYVSESNRRKDYVENYEIYEAKLKAPYYLIFDPETLDFVLNRHNGTRYAPVEANEAGRRPLPEAEMEVAVLGGWVRFWHKGELLPLPHELRADLTEMGRRLDEERRARERLQKENERIALEKDRAEKEKDRLALEKDRAEKERERAEKESQRITQEKDEAERRARQSAQDNDRLRQQSKATADLLRPLVEAKARQLGRQDVLDRLPSADDGDQLARWLAEMG
jgi:Uma2 family endonuclease